MRTLRCLAVLSILLLIVFQAAAQTAKDAVMALRKLQAKVEAGVTYRDYRSSLGDAKFEVDLFLEKHPPSAKEARIQSSVDKAYMHYSMAAKVWDVKIAKGRYGPCVLGYEDSDLLKILFELYPELKDERVLSGISGNYGPLCVDDFMQAAWREARKELRTAISLLSQK